jgi:hypothetical protein
MGIMHHAAFLLMFVLTASGIILDKVIYCQPLFLRLVMFVRACGAGTPRQAFD